MQIFISEIETQISRIKIRNRKSILSNYYGQLKKEDGHIMDFFQTDNAIVFTVKVNEVIYGYFYGSQPEEIRGLLKKLPKDTIVEYIAKAESTIDNLFTETGFQKYAVFERLIDPNLSDFFDTEKNRYGCLFQRFVPTEKQCQEYYAVPEDADETLALLHASFDKYVGHFPTKEELLQDIDEKHVLLYREENRIMALHIYRLEGKKYYSYISINKGSFFMMYSLLAIAIKDACTSGASYGYCWVKENNEPALRYCGSKGFYPDGIKNIIYHKEN